MTIKKNVMWWCLKLQAADMFVSYNYIFNAACGMLDACMMPTADHWHHQCSCAIYIYKRCKQNDVSHHLSMVSISHFNDDRMNIFLPNLPCNGMETPGRRQVWGHNYLKCMMQLQWLWVIVDRLRNGFHGVLLDVMQNKPCYCLCLNVFTVPAITTTYF